jgi:hypothetical protein
MLYGLLSRSRATNPSCLWCRSILMERTLTTGADRLQHPWGHALRRCATISKTNASRTQSGRRTASTRSLIVGAVDAPGANTNWSRGRGELAAKTAKPDVVARGMSPNEIVGHKWGVLACGWAGCSPIGKRAEEKEIIAHSTGAPELCVGAGVIDCAAAVAKVHAGQRGASSAAHRRGQVGQELEVGPAARGVGR